MNERTNLIAQLHVERNMAFGLKKERQHWPDSLVQYSAL
jgi:hypothetical protein